ncbi:MAG: hypothetical protein EOO46_16015 [Flavobacterium sp.]|nr:MAG: hypothetical protein EOO46_16015 [Flavobacterium sp.]
MNLNINESFAQTTTTVSKKCGKCGKSVSINSKIGDICPHCGVRWGYENSTTTSTTVVRPKYENYIDIYSPYTSSAKTSTTKNTNNTTPPKPNPFASYSKQMTEQWLLQRFKQYAKKRVYCSTDPILSIGGCTTYDDFEFKFDSEYLIVKYNYNNEYVTVVYIPLYDFSYAYGKDYGSDFSISTTSNTMYEVNKKDNSKRAINYISIGFKNDAETDLIDNIEFALKNLKKYYKKPTTSYLPEFISQSEINKPSLSETQSWILSKLNSYQKNLSIGSYDGSSSNSYSNFTFSFSGYNMIINFKETSSLRAYGNDNTWTHYYTVTVPICECSFYRPSNNRGVGAMTYGGGNFGFSSSRKSITKTEQGRSTEYASSFDISIDFDRENDLFNRLQKAFNTLKTYCPTQVRPKEAF